MSAEVAARIAIDPESVFGPDDEPYSPDEAREMYEQWLSAPPDDDPAQFDTVEERRQGHRLEARRYWLAMNAGTL